MLTTCHLLRSAPEQVILVRSRLMVATVFCGVFPSPPFCSHQVHASPTWMESFRYVWLASVCRSSRIAVFWLTSTAEALRSTTRNQPSPVTVTSMLDVPLVAKAEDCETVPVAGANAGPAPCVPVSYEANRMAAPGSGFTVTCNWATFDRRALQSLIT